MPPSGVKSAKRARQYEHIKESALKRGRSARRAKQIAAATVNKQRRQAGETKSTGSRGRKTSVKGSRSPAAARKRGSASGSRKSAGSRKK